MRTPFAIPHATFTIPVETRLAASPASGTNKDRDTNTKTKPKKDLAAFRRALLRWYDQNRRDLPWRETRDPYRIWLSEIMLQQTRVAAVLEYYRTFLERFPNIEALAASSEDAVLTAWSGLGYYRRASRLHRCAKEIVQNHDGRFPQHAEELETLPGIGRYTAAAISSIAFAEPVAVVDGNVERVLRRLVKADTTATKNLTEDQLWQQAQTLLESSRPGDFNQAMMELGAMVCVPLEPRCPACPVRKFCNTRQFSQTATPLIGSQHATASLGKRPQSIRQFKKKIWCVLNQRNGGILLVQRSKRSSLMPGMWELPQSPVCPPRLTASVPWRTFRHSITVTDYTVYVLRNIPLQNVLLPRAYFAGKGKWIAIDRIPTIPITGLTRKILKADSII
jgi:A/G-specific adenine glycosylase